MSDINQTAIEFLRTRRSRPAKTLQPPVPSRLELNALLEMASRSPDHGKLEPWRFVVIEREAMARLAQMVRARAGALGLDEAQADKGAAQYEQGNLAVVVVESQKPSDKIPAIEQTYAAGGVCLSLLNAALASGWGANWLTGWPSHDATFTADAFGLSKAERVAGIIHIGTETVRPPERPRPDTEALTTWLST